MAQPVLLIEPIPLFFSSLPNTSAQRGLCEIGSPWHQLAVLTPLLESWHLTQLTFHLSPFFSPLAPFPYVARTVWSSLLTQPVQFPACPKCDVPIKKELFFRSCRTGYIVVWGLHASVGRFSLLKNTCCKLALLKPHVWEESGRGGGLLKRGKRGCWIQFSLCIEEMQMPACVFFLGHTICLTIIQLFPSAWLYLL